MVKLWCPICTTIPRHRGGKTTQSTIDAHMQNVHNTPVTSKNRANLRRQQNSTWNARKRDLDARWKENRRDQAIAWRVFAQDTNGRGKMPGRDEVNEGLLVEEAMLMEVGDDGPDVRFRFSKAELEGKGGCKARYSFSIRDETTYKKQRAKPVMGAGEGSKADVCRGELQGIVEGMRRNGGRRVGVFEVKVERAERKREKRDSLRE